MSQIHNTFILLIIDAIRILPNVLKGGQIPSVGEYCSSDLERRSGNILDLFFNMIFKKDEIQFNNSLERTFDDGQEKEKTKSIFRIYYF